MSETSDRESKTEQPTQKRLADAKKKGSAPYSRDLPVMFNVAGIWLVLSFLLGSACVEIALALRPFIDRPEMWELQSGPDASALLQFIASHVLGAAIPIVLLLGGSGLAGSLSQYSGLSLTRVKPDFARLSPAAGWKRLFGRAGLANNAKAVVKIMLVAAAAVWSLRDIAASTLASGALDPAQLSKVAVVLLIQVVRNVFAVIIIVAGADALMARYFWLRDLKMTKQEIKEEAKEADGDQTIKQRMRMIARQRLKKRMMAAVPQATVVIANPTHFAVALRYVRSEGGAPRVVAKGQDAMALRIRAVAEQSGVPVVENKPLARALYDAVPLDAYLPPEFYRAVAEIISAIMGRQKTGPAGQSGADGGGARRS